jgi:hypothetical protein
MSRPVPFYAVASAAYAAVVLQAAHPVLPEAGPNLCPFRMLIGLPCPGCGMGHAVVYALRGDLSASFAAHPLGIPLLALWTAWLAWGALNLARGRDFSAGFLPALRRPAISWAALALVLVVYAARLGGLALV